MITPIDVTRNEFPDATRSAAGMTVLNFDKKDYEVNYLPNITYLERNGQKLHLQLLLPADADVPTPLILFIPGSAFKKQDVISRVPSLCYFARKGYAVALLEYRGSETAIFPSVIVDTKAGLVFMRDRAAKYNINPEKIFVMGDSSGGYTALMAGLTHSVASLEDEFSCGKAYPVRGIIDYFGPTDFTTMNEFPSTQNHLEPDSPEGLFIGKKRVDAASALVQSTIIKNYVSDGRALPPVIMFHGSADELVPFSQSCELYEALKENGHRASLYQIKGAHHGGREFWSDTVLELVMDFLFDCI